MQSTHAVGLTTERVLSRHELLELGYRPKQITKAVRLGELTRLRRDHYVLSGDEHSIAQAVRLGGRLTCVSAIAAVWAEVFVLARDHVHVHAGRDRSRLRMPDDASRRWSRAHATGVRLSRRNLTELPANRHLVAPADAIGELVRCLPEREAIATIDSLLFLGAMSMTEVRDAFGSLPERYRRILPQLDARAESGPESFMRLILRELGLRFEVQVTISGVGRVDFVVEGYLIVECDSRSFHEGWEKQRQDRKRDLAAAAQGYFTLRVLAEDLMYHPDEVAAALRKLLAARDSRPTR